ncbi:MAG: DUF2959 family protein [Planctomycetes bacterium]|nr:DUF2959 family protein [Planctomycetota bacterium]
MPAAMRNALAALAIASAALAGSCAAPHSRPPEAFWTSLSGTLARTIESARDAQEKARDELMTAHDAMIQQVASQDAEGSYREGRRIVARCESRIKTASDRARNVSDNSKDIFARWEREARDYADPGLRDQSLRELSAAQGRSKRMLAAVNAADASFNPVLLGIKDDSLYLKHRRGVANPPAPQYTQVAKREKDLAAMTAAVETSRKECDAYLAIMPRPVH